MNDINVLYTCDDAYLPLTGISIASVIENNRDSAITFYIATESNKSENLRKLNEFYEKYENIDFRFLDCTQYDEVLKEKGLDRWGSSSYYVYWKLYAYDLLDCDHVWYLDSDVICMNKISDPDIDKPIGAVLDSAHACFNKVAHIDENFYFFNTGSLFVDVKKWKENKCTQKIIDHIRNMEHMPLMCDQDILAAALQKEIEVIDPKYDYLVGYDYYGVHNSFEMYSLDRKPFYKESQIEQAREHVVFYHCLGGVFGRPWEVDNDSPIKEVFDKYRSMSPWPDFHTKRRISVLFRAEKALEILPKFLYNRIHNFAMRLYVKRLGK
ncbi:MAG: hypothetical protein IKS54_00095 [Erysipelotrichaceae bacterium]|nr:hypothetical protein [Erysipelotrichaceae bacterium]